MRTIIAGSRTINDPFELDAAIEASGFEITEIVSGGAQGVDSMGLNHARANNIPVKIFVPDWKTYGKAAGPIRNTEMADNADALILVWDGKSRGSADMLNKAQDKGLKVYVHIIKQENEDEC